MSVLITALFLFLGDFVASILLPQRVIEPKARFLLKQALFSSESFSIVESFAIVINSLVEEDFGVAERDCS
jgi:hypothetical protein